MQKKGENHRVADAKMFQHYIEIQFYPLKNYVEQMELSINKIQREFYKYLDNSTKGFSKEEESEFIDRYYDELVLKRDLLPKLVRYGFIIQTFSILENLMNKICKAHIIRKNIKETEIRKKIRVKRKVGNWYVRNCLEYLKEFAGLEKIMFSNLGRMISLLNDIRNAIVHDNGKLDNRQPLKKKIKIHKELKVNIDNEIEVTKEYIENKINFLEKFLPKLAFKIKII